MKDDLVKRLKAGTGGGKHWMELHEEDADRIGELEAKLAELLAAVEQAIETYKQPHYGDTDTELDNAYDAINLLCDAVTKLKGDKT